MSGFVDLTPPPTPRDRAWQLAYRVGFPLARAWWSLSRPAHRGALVELQLGGRVLLLRSSYRREWGFPGGGLIGGETPAEAARRELWEETGLDLAVEGPATILEGDWDGLRDRVHVFRLSVEGEPSLRFDNREIVGAALFAPEALAGLRLTGAVAAYWGARGSCDAARF